MDAKFATPRRSALPAFSSTSSPPAAPGSNPQRGSVIEDGAGVQASTSTSIPGGSRPSLSGRRSQSSLRQPGAVTGSAAAALPPQTPRRSIPSATGRATPSLPAASQSSDGDQAQQQRKLEIGDEVYADVNSIRYSGVLRHIGPVHFRPGMFAGLELTGDSEGKGRNDGCVEGQQYFACEPGNGIFFLAARVHLLGNGRSQDATARPQSAQSIRSGRSSAMDDYYRPPSTTPARPRSSTSMSMSRRSSATPVRPSSRISNGRPASRTSRVAAPAPALPRPHLQSRPSGVDAAADEDDRQRATTSAAEAVRAEERITQGSRAHKLLNMSARDLQARRDAGSSNAVFAPSRKLAGSSLASPPKPVSVAPSSASAGSPLKQNLLGSSRLQATPKNRASVGSALPTSNATPRVAKARPSLQGQPVTAQNSMLPPPPIPGSPSKQVAAETRSTPLTPRRQSVPGSSDAGDTAPLPSDESVAQRNRSLLEQMDLLTPRRPVQQPSPGATNAGLGLIADNDSETFAPVPDNLTDEVLADEDAVQGYVPAVYLESANEELVHVKLELQNVSNALRDAQAKSEEGRHAELEQAKIKALEQARCELEEEQRVEREDDARRRKTELESREKEWKSKTEGISRERKKADDENARICSDLERKATELEARLRESETLVSQLQTSVSASDSHTTEAEAKQLELTQLKERLQRVEATQEQERQQHIQEVDDLKSAGQEALDMYVTAQASSDERIVELENSLHLLEARAQEAIAEAERQRDDAVRQAGDMSTSAKASAVAEIDQQSLQQQLEQAQSRVTHLEDQVAEVNALVLQERVDHSKRREKHVESEGKLKEDVSRYRGAVQHLERSEAEARNRIQELTDALEERRTTLENERAELETLRAEALIMGEGPDGQAVQALEKGRFEAEIERLQGLLEGARSGKREASRQSDELRTQNAELHALVEDVRSHLRSVESDKQKLLEGAGTRSMSSTQFMAEVRQEVDALRQSGRPLADQTDALLKTVEKELFNKDQELVGLRRRFQERGQRYSSDSQMLLATTNGTGAFSPSRGASMESERSVSYGSGLLGTSTAESNTSNTITSPSWTASKRISTASSHSRRSYGSIMGTPGTNGSSSALLSTSEGAAKELTGLRSLVNTLSQELTEAKASSTQRERELKEQAEKMRGEARRLESRKAAEQRERQERGNSVETSSTDTGGSEATDARFDLERQLQDALRKIANLESRLGAVEKAKRDETGKLNQDIAELEALCEATVWRKEEQEAKREELERKVAKLQRQLDRAQEHEHAQQQQQRASNSSIESAKTVASSGHSTTDGGSSKDTGATCDDCGESGHKMEDCPYVNDDMLF